MDDGQNLVDLRWNRDFYSDWRVSGEILLFNKRVAITLNQELFSNKEQKEKSLISVPLNSDLVAFNVMAIDLKKRGFFLVILLHKELHFIHSIIEWGILIKFTNI